jgi:NADPH2:quinone reductase
LFATGRVKPVTYTEIYNFEQLADGLGALEKRQTWGKAVVRVKEETTGERAKL